MKAVRAALIAGTLAAALGACTGSFFKSSQPPPSTYLLSVPAAPAAGTDALPVDLTVLTPRVRTGLDSDRIAALYPDRRLEYFAGARWSGPLDEVMQDLALQAFQGRVRNVGTDTSAFNGGYWLEIDIVDFQAEYPASGVGPPSVHVHLLGRVGNGTDRHMLGELEADASVPARDNRMTAVVAAYGDAATRALDQMVAGTTRALAGLSQAARQRPEATP